MIICCLFNVNFTIIAYYKMIVEIKKQVGQDYLFDDHR